MLLRTDWSKKGWRDYADLKDDGAHTPGPEPAVMRWLVEERGVIGFGTETIGTDAGQAGHLRSALSGAPFTARRRALRPAMPVQSRSASADRRGDRGRAAQDPERLRQSAARACAGTGAGLSLFVHIE